MTETKRKILDEAVSRGDVAAILRKAATCTSRNTSVGDVLRCNVPRDGNPSARECEEDACEALADMVERGYVQRDSVERDSERVANLKASELLTELHEVERERDSSKEEARHWKLVADRHEKDRQALVKELNKARREGGLPDGIEWPRFEGGELVEFGDEFMWCDEVHTVDKFEFQRGLTLVCGQARCAETPVKRPPLLASDGQPIEVGQVLYGGDGRAWEVYHLDRAAKHPVFGREPGNPGAAREMKPEWLTREQPDSWERIAEDIRAINGDAYAHSGTADLEPIAERVEKLAGGAR